MSASPAWTLACGFALVSTGCCEIVHLGWSRSVGPRSWRELRTLAPRVASSAVTDARGDYDVDTCERACSSGGRYDVERCYPVSAAAPERARRAIICHYDRDDPRNERRLVPRSGLEGIAVGPSDVLEEEYCKKACLRGDDEVNYCELPPELVPPPPPNEPLLVCELYQGAHCADPVLTRAIPPPRHAAQRARPRSP